MILRNVVLKIERVEQLLWASRMLPHHLETLPQCTEESDNLSKRRFNSWRCFSTELAFSGPSSFIPPMSGEGPVAGLRVLKHRTRGENCLGPGSGSVIHYTKILEIGKRLGFR